MIQVNELRVGNCVKVFNDDFNKIHVISKTAVQVEGGIIGGEVFKLEHINPIHLTPEILERCGFECFGDTYIGGLVYINKCIRFVFNDNLMSFVLFGDTPIHEIKYLHQLQNLYFALTGEELQYQCK